MRPTDLTSRRPTLSRAPKVPMLGESRSFDRSIDRVGTVERGSRHHSDDPASGRAFHASQARACCKAKTNAGCQRPVQTLSRKSGDV